MSSRPKPWMPLAVVVLAVTAMAVAARHDGTVRPGVGDGVWESARPAVALGALVLLIVVAANFAKRRDDGYGVLHRAGTATALLLTAAAVLTPAALLFLGRKPQPPASPGDSKNGPVTNTPTSMRQKVHHLPPPKNSKVGGDWIVNTVFYVLAIAAIIVAAYLLSRLIARLWPSSLPIVQLEFDPFAAELEDLAEAVAAGTEALEYAGDAREAVIACYSAMEEAVGAGGGSRRRATDTPEEFLRRVTASRLIPEAAATRLTDLFREARFSRHPITEDQRNDAREALREISEHLRVRAEELAAVRAEAAPAGRT